MNKICCVYSIKNQQHKYLTSHIQQCQRQIVDSNGKIFDSLVKCSKFHKISVQTVCDILKGRHSKTRKGISFEYFES